MTGIGEILKRTRKELNLDLVEVEKETKIRKRYLEALEEEDFSIFPGKVYLIGFLRNYAAFLNLEDEPLIELLKEKLESNREEFNEKMIPVRPRRSFKRKTKLQKILRLVFLATILLAAAIYIYGAFWGTSSPEIPPVDSQIEDKLETEMQETQKELLDPVIEEKADVFAEEGINLQLKISDEADARCWLEVRVDGEVSFSGTLVSGEVKNFEAQKNIKLRLGNAGVVNLLYNGEELGTAGSKNQVIDLEFPGDF